MACRADHPLDMEDELEIVKALPGLWDVVRDIDLGLRPNTLIDLLQNGEWWEVEFVDEGHGLRRVIIREIPRPDALIRGGRSAKGGQS